MGAMVLKYVIEHASGMNYYNYVEDNILKPLGMTDTHVVVPKAKIDRVASTNIDGMYYKDGNFRINTSNPKGIVYDPKAKIMGSPSGDLTGHAGLFSTANDMTKLAKGIMYGRVIDDKYVEEMAKNRTGRKVMDDGVEKNIQYLGYLCYSKNPVLADSEIYHAMSGRTLASAGWTGNQLTVDPLNEIFLYMSGNRSHNRMTFIDQAQKDKVVTDEYGKKTIILPNGQEMIDATRFAWDRDKLIHQALRLAIQYKMLEDFYSMYKEEIKQEEKVRNI
jgi:CubicO group peptidase (beta-lactamase class C family)